MTRDFFASSCGSTTGPVTAAGTATPASSGTRELGALRLGRLGRRVRLRRRVRVSEASGSLAAPDASSGVSVDSGSSLIYARSPISVSSWSKSSQPGSGAVAALLGRRPAEEDHRDQPPQHQAGADLHDQSGDQLVVERARAPRASEATRSDDTAGGSRK